MRTNITLCAILLGGAALFAADTANRRAPGFALPDSKMEVHDLADYRGKLVILEFMQTTCPHCASFAGILNEVQQKYGDRVAILAVANSSHDNQNTVAQYISGHQVRYPILFDAGQMAYSYFRSQSFDNPHIYLIDANGIIRGDFGYGPMTTEIFEGKALFAEIDRLLAGGAAQGKK
ncbi:Redoxin domain protein [Candidatus Sulfopaludibacter sp. SbA4]|nr:Redoxin domain protein [Candidatus Sulfopaludibacter sp. SbA4]